MIIVIIYMIISFMLDALISNFINMSITNPSIFNTIYSVIALVIIYNYFDDDNKYIKILLVLGILFDIVYTSTFLLNIFIFIVIYIVIKFINEYIPNNLFTINIKSLIAISLYHILSYLILMLVHYDYYSFKCLLLMIPKSIIMSVIYTSISYIMMKKIYFKKYTKKIK